MYYDKILVKPNSKTICTIKNKSNEHIFDAYESKCFEHPNTFVTSKVSHYVSKGVKLFTSIDKKMLERKFP